MSEQKIEQKIQKGSAVCVVRCLSIREEAAIWVGYEGEVREVGKDFYGVRLFDVYRRLSHEMHYFQLGELEMVVRPPLVAKGYISGGR